MSREAKSSGRSGSTLARNRAHQRARNAADPVLRFGQPIGKTKPA